MPATPVAVRHFNKFAVRLAGRRFLPVWAIVRHRGRVSGRQYATPVAVIATPTTFVIGLPWGRGTDWVRNVRCASGCTVRWKGQDFTCVEPTFVDKSVAVAAASGLVRRVLQRREFQGGFLQLSRTLAR